MIRVEDLVVQYGDRIALKGLGFQIDEGEIVVLLGPNGSGKTTLLKAICRAVPKISGRIQIKSKDISELSTRELAKEIAYVPQFEQQIFDFTVEELSLMGRYLHTQGFNESDADISVAEKAMITTDSISLRHRNHSTLSGGEAQRVLMARALAQESPILLCDEPTNSLDPVHQIELGKLLRQLASSGKTIIVSTHDLNWAYQFRSRALFLKEGSQLYFGSMEQALNEGIHEQSYDATFLRSEVGGTTLFMPKYDSN